MQAAVYEGVGQVTPKELPDPKCPPGGLVLRVDACAICGTDVKVFRMGHPRVQPPQVTGHEIAGSVVEISPEAGERTSLKPGDRVVAMPNFNCGLCEPCVAGAPSLCERSIALGYEIPGGFAEYLAIPAFGVNCGAILSFAGDVPAEQASLAEPLACVIAGQEKVALGLGDRVVVVGTGAIGCMHIALARLRGASQIVAVDVVAAKLRLAEPFGADAYVDASRENPVERVRSLTGGRGADVVIVAAPTVAAHQVAVGMAALRGRICFFAGLPVSTPRVELDARALHYRELLVVGTFASNHVQNRLAVDLVAGGRIDMAHLITHRLPLAEVARGIELVESGRALKVVVTPGSR